MMSSLPGQMVYRLRQSLRRRMGFPNPPQPQASMLIYTMRKAGSSTMMESLKPLMRERGIKVHKCHHLSLGLIIQIERSLSGMGKPKPQWFLRGNRLRPRPRSWKKAKKENPRLPNRKIITLIRDPIAVIVSEFFANVEIIFPDFVKRYRSHQVSLRQVGDRFLEVLGDECYSSSPISRHLRTMFDIPLIWFEAELETMFGIDILSEPFPRDKGYRVYHGEFADVLLIKCEVMDRCALEATGQFLNIRLPALVRSNLSNEKPYHEAYVDFKDSLVLPDRVLEKYYSSPYVQHCYSGEEIQSFRRQWSTARHAEHSTLMHAR